MIADALAGRIDLIVTKSVSRFARNTVDSLTTVRQLKERGVEIYFEKENIWTLDSNEHRYRFTGGHEAGHGIFHAQYYGYNRNQISFFSREDDLPIVKCRAATIQNAGSLKKVEFETDQEWMEWQANYFASALLMPRSMVKKLVEEYDGDEFSKDLLLTHIISETFNVSLTAAENRLKSLGMSTPHRLSV